METNDIIAQLFERANATQVFWNFFIVVATAILAFLAAIKITSNPVILCVILTLVFILFAFSNYRGLNNTRIQRVAIVEYALSSIDCENNKLKAVIESGRPKSENKLLAFHLLVDVIILILIWGIPFLKIKG